MLKATLHPPLFQVHSCTAYKQADKIAQPASRFSMRSSLLHALQVHCDSDFARVSDLLSIMPLRCHRSQAKLVDILNELALERTGLEQPHPVRQNAPLMARIHVHSHQTPVEFRLRLSSTTAALVQRRGRAAARGATHPNRVCCKIECQDSSMRVFELSKHNRPPMTACQAWTHKPHRPLESVS